MPPLKKQTVDIPLVRGLETKTSSKLASAAELSVLENYEFEGGSLSRRFGSARLYSPEGSGSSVKPGRDAMLGLLDGRIVLRDRDRLFPFSEETGTLSVTGILKDGDANRPIPSPSLLLTKTRLHGSARRIAYPSSARNAGVQVYAWTEISQSGDFYGRLTVQDEDGASLALPQQLSESAVVSTSAKCVAVAGGVVAVYVAGTTLYFRLVSIVGGALVVGPEQTIDTGLNSAVAVDAVSNPDGSFTAVAYKTSSSNVLLRVYKVTTGGTVTATTLLTIATSSIGSRLTATVRPNGDAYIFYGKLNGSSQMTVRGLVVNSAHTVVTADVEVVAGAANRTPSRLSSAPSLSDGRVWLAYDEGDAVVSAQRKFTTSLRELSEALLVQLSLDFPQMRLLSRPFYLGGSDIHVVVGSTLILPTQSVTSTTSETLSLQPTVFVLNQAREVVARAMAGELEPYGFGGGTITSSDVAVFEEESAPVVRFPVLGNGKSGTGAAYVLYELELRRDVVGGDRLVPVQYGGSLYFPGAVPRQYDGRTLHEVGFHLLPELVDADAAAVIATPLAAGTYECVAVYEWVDAAGELHQSAPSVPVSVTLTGSAGSQAIAWTVPYLKLTDKTTTPVSVALYRTVANGTIHYRVPKAADGINVENVESGSTTFASIVTEETADAILSTKEILYTDAGVAENIAPPACRHMCVHEGRLVLSGTEDGAVHFSDKLVDGYGPYFHEDFILRPRADGDQVVASASMDGRLILLKRNSLEFVSGEGPDETGLGGRFSEAQWITSETGCAAPQSVVVTPLGVMFQGARGLYLLRRGDLGLQELGSPEALVGTVTGALHVPGKQQVRFFQSEPEATLVYNYAYGQWGAHVPRAIASAVPWRESSAWVAAGASGYSSLWWGDPSAVSDNGEAVQGRFVTGWIRVAGLQGVQRVWWIHLLGTCRGHSLVSVDVGYDYEEDFRETARVYTSDLGLEEGDPIVVRFKPKLQRCKALRLRVTCDGGGDEPSRGADWTGISLELGVQPGLFKLGSLKTMGQALGSAGT